METRTARISKGSGRCSSATSSTTSRSSAHPGLVEKYAKDLKSDAWDRVLFDRGLLGLAIGISSLCIVLGIGWGLFAAAFHAFMYVFVLSASINGLCHYHGYRNFDNTATNIRFVAWLTGGEGLHNNHHGYPRSPKFSFRRGEFDPAWPIIRALTALNLARPYKTIEQHQGAEARRRAFLSSRDHLPDVEPEFRLLARPLDLDRDLGSRAVLPEQRIDEPQQHRLEAGDGL